MIFFVIIIIAIVRGRRCARRWRKVVQKETAPGAMSLIGGFILQEILQILHEDSQTLLGLVGLEVVGEIDDRQ